MAGTLIVNGLLALAYVSHGTWKLNDMAIMRSLTNMTLLNVALAFTMRQQYILNIFYWLSSRLPSSSPLPLRWWAGKVNHVGGLHVGGALAATAYFTALIFVQTVSSISGNPNVSVTALVASYAIVMLMIVIVVCAHARVRERAHDLFEMTHRFGGWAALALLSFLVVHEASAARPQLEVLRAATRDWHVWLVVGLIGSVALPWLRLRRVPVTVTRPSNHAAIVTFDYGVTPAVGCTIAVSRSPLCQWHPFATIVTPDRTGYEFVVSRAGDWTSRFIDDPPTHLWVKNIPSAAFTQLEVSYERVLYVATGSGIGPLLNQVFAGRVPGLLLWSTRSPRSTYGDDLVDRILAAQPDALIWDTTTSGRPDLLSVVEAEVDNFGADAVFVVSNPKLTGQVVKGMERRGVPTLGPIWDS